MISSVGSLLKEERKRKRLTYKDVEKATHIRSDNLKAIEQDAWKQFPSRTYIQGVIKGYGAFLGLDTVKLVAYFRRDYERREGVKFKRALKPRSFTPLSKRIFWLGLGIVCVVFGLFFGYQLYVYSVPPNVSVTSPESDTFRHEKKITLEGRADPETVIKVNGEQVFLDERNMFSVDIPLLEERNRVLIEATGANGKKTVIERLFIKKD